MGGASGDVWLVDPAGAQAPLRLPAEGSPVRCLAASADGHVLASSHEDGAIRVWDAVRGQVKLPLTPLVGSLGAIALSADGELLARVDKNEIEVWRIKSLQREPFNVDSPHWVNCVAWSPDGARLAAGYGNGQIRQWRLDDMHEFPPLLGHSGAIQSLAFSPDGRTLASGGSAGSVRLWSVATHQLLCTLGQHPAAAASIAFSTDGATLASSAHSASPGKPSEILVWRVVDEAAINEEPGPKSQPPYQ